MNTMTLIQLHFDCHSPIQALTTIHEVFAEHPFIALAQDSDGEFEEFGFANRGEVYLDEEGYVCNVQVIARVQVEEAVSAEELKEGLGERIEFQSVQLLKGLQVGIEELNPTPN